MDPEPPKQRWGWCPGAAYCRGEEVIRDDQELAALGAAAEAGDRDAEDELVQVLAEGGDADGLRHWARRGNSSRTAHEDFARQRRGQQHGRHAAR